MNSMCCGSRGICGRTGSRRGSPISATPRVSGIAWTADGREIVYAAGGVQTPVLWRVPVSGRQAPRRLPYALPAAIFPAIARTPPRLVYTWQVYNMNLWRLDTRTGERRMLIGSTYDSRIPQYSPDGRKIAFQSNRSGSVESLDLRRGRVELPDSSLPSGAAVWHAALVAGWPLAGLGFPCGGAVRDLRDGGGRGHAAPHDQSPRVTTSSRAGRATAVGSISAPTAAAATRSGRCPKDGGASGPGHPLGRRCVRWSRRMARHLLREGSCAAGPCSECRSRAARRSRCCRQSYAGLASA